MTNRNYYSNPRRDVLGLLQRTKANRILEIGGGDFPTLIEAQSQLGGEAWGIDVRPSTSKIDRMIVGSVTDDNVQAQLADVKFDVIIANDVVEHVEDSHTFFAIIKRHLADGGDLLLSVPNVRNVKLLYHIFIRGRFPREDAGLFDKTHLRWFCRKDIEWFAEASELRIVDHRYGGRYITNSLTRFKPMEFLSLHNIFCLKHK